MNLFFSSHKIEAGCDEAGRGCLAGPVVAAAVILDKNNPILGLNDSKQLSPKKRQTLLPIIKQNALAYAVAFIYPERIDEVNILNASFEAMHKAIDKLQEKPELLLIDGNRFVPYPNIEHHCIVKGDAKFQSIAAASILAKEARDEYMKKIDLEFPQYEWKKNMGYPTKSHKSALYTYGATKYHRKTFKY